MGPRNTLPCALLALVAALALSSACGLRGAETAAWARRVEDLRTTAERRHEAGDPEGATAALREALAEQSPDDRPAVRLLRQDTHFALGQVLFERGRFDEAMAEADRGLALSDERSVFAANLHALRAMCLEERGDPAGALGEYASALAIHEEHFARALAAHRAGERTH